MLIAHIIAICYAQKIILLIFKYNFEYSKSSVCAIRRSFLDVYVFIDLVSFSPFFAFHFNSFKFTQFFSSLYFYFILLFFFFHFDFLSFAFVLCTEPGRIVFGLISLALAQSTNNSNKSTKKVRKVQIKFSQNFISKIQIRLAFEANKIETSFRLEICFGNKTGN